MKNNRNSILDGMPTWAVVLLDIGMITLFVLFIRYEARPTCKASGCNNSVYASGYCYAHQPSWAKKSTYKTYNTNSKTSGTTSSNSGNTSSGSNTYKSSGNTYKSNSSSTSDPYDVKEYSDPEDFYYDNYDDFYDYEDAEDYYYEYGG